MRPRSEQRWPHLPGFPPGLLGGGGPAPAPSHSPPPSPLVPLAQGSESAPPPPRRGITPACNAPRVFSRTVAHHRRNKRTMHRESATRRVRGRAAGSRVGLAADRGVLPVPAGADRVYSALSAFAIQNSEDNAGSLARVASGSLVSSIPANHARPWSAASTAAKVPGKREEGGEEAAEDCGFRGTSGRPHSRELWARGPRRERRPHLA